MFGHIGKKLGSLTCIFSLLAGMLAVPAAVHGEASTSSISAAAAVPPISTIDSSRSTNDKIVMNVDGKPFFFNGIQVRDDKIMQRFHYTDAQMKNVYQLAADNGFTVVNSQILWSMVQPDQIYPAIESTYIAGGSNADINFSSNNSVKAKYDAADPSNQALSYLKFDFSNISGTSADAAKIRIYVNAMDTGTANLHLYGIANDSWNASTMTWNSGAPNHNGYNLTGTEGVDYFDLGGTPSYDPVNKVAAYDFDVTDFLNNHAYVDGKKASFILKTDTSDNIGVTIDGATGTTFKPSLVISRADVYDYSWVDKVIGWAEAADLKLELMWFGSDTTKVTADNRVPYYVTRNYEKAQTAAGRVLDGKGGGTDLIDSTVYTFVMSKDDPNLRNQEYTALKNLFDHVAVYNSAHGNKKTVVGADISNEPGNSIGDERSHSPYSEALYQSGGYSSNNLFMYDSYWTWAQNLGAAVKQSNYPVWTRINFHSDQFNFVYRNEEAKANGETSYVDFVGYDPYIGTTDEGFRYGLGLWSDAQYLTYNYAGNLPMIMETSASKSNSDYLNLATLAGGSVYNLYNLMANDGNDLYNNGPDNIPVANNSNIGGIKKTNFWLQTLGYDLATKQPDAAGGTKLKFFNEHGDTSANVTKKIRGIDVNYSTSNKGVGIAVEKSAKSIAIASKTASTFTLRNLLTYGPVTMTTGYYDMNNNWVSTGTKSFSASGNDAVISMNEYETVQVVTTAVIPEGSRVYGINDDFNSQSSASSPSGWTVSTSGGTVDITNKPGRLDKSLRINRTTTSAGQSYAEKAFAPLSGIVKVETTVRKDATNQWFAAPYVYDSAGNAAINIAFDATGNIVYKNASGVWTTLQSYQTRTWFKLEMEINTNTDTYDLYINGVKKLSQAPLTMPVSDIAKVKFYTETAGSGNYDNVKVYQEIGGDVNAPIRFQGETTPVTTSGVAATSVSDNSASGSGYFQTEAATTTTGNWVEFTVNVSAPGTYNVDFGYKKNTGRGTTQLTIDGVKQGNTVDQYAGTAAYAASDLGNVILSAGSHTLRFTVTGKNTSSSSYMFTIDYVELTRQAADTTAVRFQGETTPVTSSGVATTSVSDNSASGGGYFQTDAASTSTGNWIEFTVNVPASGTYNVDFGYKKNTGRGMTQVAIDGMNQGSTVDQYASTVSYSASDLGNVSLSAGSHVLRFTVTGKNASSSSYAFTVDYVELTPN